MMLVVGLMEDGMSFFWRTPVFHRRAQGCPPRLLLHGDTGGGQLT
jgi:hypothetical protein